MSQSLDARARERGTKFLIYPQNKTVPGFEQPEVVYIDSTPGSIQAGPEDERIYVVDSINKKPFGFPGAPRFSYRYTDLHAAPPVQPNAEGHFDHVRPGSREFSAATMYATVRRVMDIWQDYFGMTIPWPFNHPKLLLIPKVNWDNAQSGFDGFLEFGYPLKQDNRNFDLENPYCENFDVLAHEVGHTFKYEIIGIPQEETDEYGGHHEAFGDLVAIVATLHSDLVVEHLLSNTKGNLFSLHELSRMGELRNGFSIRVAFNDKTMENVSREPHDLSEPFTGGAFDILVEMFQINLIEKNLISQQLGDRAYHAHFEEIPEIQEQFTRHYLGKESEFKTALLDARDKFGKLMANAWKKTSAENLHYGTVLRNILNADQELYNGKYERVIRSCFDWRGITTETFLEAPQLKTHIVDELRRL
ncbi:hypothetical protein AAHB57_29870 [Bacillus cereus]|uniref:hypothetical protein n=1 Tax=Bacillus thuringiensis TaxID=1428 RepID=UPI000BF77E9E|nr:hypothetical protein [Bacillus thuringiensis]PFF59220.1 hypothetical protein CN358_22195 [Bacillus thuringiensis]